MTRTRYQEGPDRSHYHDRFGVAGTTPSGVTLAVSTDDPGAVGAGNVWLEETAIGWHRLWVRNDADDGWIAASPSNGFGGEYTYISSTDGLAEIGLSDATDFSYFISTSGLRLTGGRQIFLDAAGLHIGNASAPIIRSGAEDPSAGAGVAAPVGSIFLRTDGNVWRKTSAPDTGWVTP